MGGPEFFEDGQEQVCVDGWGDRTAEEDEELRVFLAEQPVVEP